jgi:hypothetical protein
LAHSGFPITRGFCYELGYSVRRFYWGVALLRSARVMKPRGRTLMVEDFVEAEQRVNAKYQALKKAPDARMMFACLSIYQSRRGKPFDIGGGFAIHITQGGK